ncbi:tetratricopeptide repeat-containing glycosyltransferase family protein [Allorhizobium sp. BGMRC 0089]|uniref:tetratricopeptide repeat-containing glycosyltransferase family protein n=1 Tax=Allorhizobium sonneratiae TaxID=2934936 RepID=UPI0020332E0C|nr:tetratricopeptide repeat-containing glycosyltransferase family protein [Allorhizobium sonneratiae]MCM2290769.1 tetratricopeptide repeat-containing glycosyltransferase family protein [Allorhizobium sonneratiae]
MSDEISLQQLLQRGFNSHREGQFEAAIADYQAVLSAEPDNVDALRLTGAAFRALGDLNRALAHYTRALRLAPDNGDIWYNLGNALGDTGRREDALEAYQRAAELMPDKPAPLANIGVTLAALGRADEAMAAYEKALALDPDHRIALHNLGNAHSDRGEMETAVRLLRRATALYPELAEAHYNLGLNLLRLQDYTQGFAEYEWRWQAKEFPSPPRHQTIPDWDGRPFAGKTLLIHAEQGLGDTIQFAKLLPLVKSLGGTVIFQAPDRLERLLNGIAGADRVTCRDPGPGEADLQSPLLGLPHRLRLTLGSVPTGERWLYPATQAVARWRERLGLEEGARAIGFVWRGNPLSPAEKGRSLDSAEALKPFAALENTRLIALQKLSEDEIELAETPSGWKVKGLPFTLEYPGTDFDEGKDAFLDTAAIMACLSGVVSVCTAPLHLAGALGCPTVGLIKKVPDWRWGLSGETSPWYPSLTLIRQQVAGDYAPAIAEAVVRMRAIIDKR